MLFLDCENFVIFSKLQIKVGTRVFPGLVIPFRPALLCTHHLLVNKNGDEFLTYLELLFCSVWSSEISFKRQHQICLHFWYSFCRLRNLFVHVIAPSFCSSDIQSSAAGFIFPLLLFLLGSSKWSSGNWKRPNFVYQNILLRLKFLSHILWKAKVILVFSISNEKKNTIN